MTRETGTTTIRVEGHLDERWLPWFEGLTVATDGGTTVISGPVTDQAALLGLLQKLRDLSLPLISVVLAGPEGEHAPAGTHCPSPTREATS